MLQLLAFSIYNYIVVCEIETFSPYSGDINSSPAASSHTLQFWHSLKKGKREFKVATDQKFNPLYVRDLKKIIKLFLEKEIKGVFNVGGPEQLSRYECIEKIIKQFKNKNMNKIILKKSKLKNFKFLDKRPLNITMNINKIKKIIKFKLTKIDDVAKEIIKRNQLNEKLFNRR